MSGEWWTKPYKGGPMIAVPGFPRPLYPPEAKHQGRDPSKDGPDVVAYKRTVCRMGRWKPWDPASWDDSFNNLFSQGRGTGMVGDSGVRGIQRQQGLDQTGWVGEKTFNLMRSARVPDGPNEGEMAMDSVAVNLIEEAWAIYGGDPTPETAADVEGAIVDYCKRSINANPGIHYSQARAMTHLGVPPENGFTADCSGHSTSSYYWARKVTSVPVPDPNHSGFNGYGYTGTLINNPEVKAPYEVGDLAIYGDSYGDTSHVVTCYKPGDAGESKWCSHGSESGPYSVTLHYRDDLLCVVRPGLTP
jgi:hypothetical protein